MKVLIIEDERYAADKLEDMLNEIDPAIKVLAKLDSIAGSVKWLTSNSAELIFLDIQISDGISFSIFEQIAVNTPIIITTAFDQYSIKAFQLNSIAYLLKPIRKSDLESSLKKYQSIKSAFNIDFDAIMSLIQGKEADYKKRFLIQIGNKITRVDVHDIAFFYVFEKAVLLKTFEGRSYPVNFTLDKLESLVDPKVFFRINRKYLVNIDAISSMTAYSRSRVKLVLKPKAQSEYDAIVSIDRSSDFKKWLEA